MTTIYPIHLSISNAYLVKGPVNMLIDTGSPGEGKKILNFLRKHGLQLSDIALILHTHGHSDHCGSTRELLNQCKIPTALHPGDLPMATSGKNGPISTTTLFSKILVLFVDKPYLPFTPDYFLDTLTDLSSFGINANILYTPGHSKGSVSIEFDNGEMVIGDILMGGMLGGALFPGRPGYHYFIEDRAEVHRSIERVLDRPVQRYWVGHGGPLKANDVRNWYLRKSSRSEKT
jgi:hydroxyacylglutathione hydrolase